LRGSVSSRPLFVARDELYLGDMAFYLTVDTRSLGVVSQHVEASADAATWGVSLALDQERTGGRIVGIAEDAAPYFGASIVEASDLLDDPWEPWVQKDVWHFQDHAGEIVAATERIALAKLAAAEKIATEVFPGHWRLADVHHDGKAEHAAAAVAIAEADAIRDAVSLLAPALAVVDKRTERIMDRKTAAWTLSRIMDHLNQHGGKRGADLAGTLQRQAAALLTFHEPLGTAMETWRQRAADHFGDGDLADLFEGQVARVWRLTQEQLSGHRPQRDDVVVAARAKLRGYCRNDSIAEILADDLREILDAVVRTSSSVECVNSLLRGYLAGRRHFSCRRTARNWLNLLVLWHNMRPFPRGKRAGSSPFDLAGVVVRGPDGQPTKDWLTALGYSEAA